MTHLTKAADIAPRPLPWLWQGFVPAGKVTIIDGRPGVGKSNLTLDLAARVTTGAPMPDGSRGIGPASVIIVTAEDDWADTVVPRLLADGADLTRISKLDDLLLPDGHAELERAIIETRAALLVIDPLVAFIPGRYNLYRDQDARRALKPLAEVMERTGCTAVALRHLSKATGIPAQDRGTGSVGIGGAARSNLIVGSDPDVPGRFVLASIKSNLSRPPTSLAFRLQEVTLQLAEVTTSVPVIEWAGTADLVADDLVVAERQGEATAFLKHLLADGARTTKEVQVAAEAAGLSWSGAVRRASERLGVIKRNPTPAVRGSAWTWELPAEPTQDAQVAQVARLGEEALPHRTDTHVVQLVHVEQGVKDGLPFLLDVTRTGADDPAEPSDDADAREAFERYLREARDGSAWARVMSPAGGLPS